MLTYHETRVALGSPVDLVLVADASEAEVGEMFRRLWLEIFLFERWFSRFLPASELSAFNRAAGTRQSISPEFRALLQAARRMAELSKGLYNPFILPALQRAGYVRSMVAAHRDDTVDDYSRLTVAKPEQLEIGADWARIPYGTALDLGGCGKGYLGDLLADLADTFQEAGGYWFSLGGDVVTGGLNDQGQPWTVLIEAVAGPPETAGCALLPDTARYAVATSSITRRKGRHNGKDWHHIIDPRSGEPAVSDLLTSTVCARSALVADVLASCITIRGSQGSEAYLAPKGALGAVLQTKGRRVVHWGEFIKRRPPAGLTAQKGSSS